MSNFTIITSNKIEATVERNRKAYIERQEKLQNLYKEENENLPPKVDCKGRLHAPCRGYRIPDNIQNIFDFTDDYSERIFEKGSYLPMPINDEFLFFNGSNSYDFDFFEEFRIEGDMIKEFKKLEEMTSQFPISFQYSRTWEYNNQQCCYVTVKSIWKSITNIVKEQMNAIEEEIRIEKEKAAAEAKAKKGTAPEGRETVTGKVVNFKGKESYYGVTWKMTVVLENGATVYGSIPQSIIEVERGDTVHFTATFEHAKDDHTHAYFKRPSKATYESAKETVDN